MGRDLRHHLACEGEMGEEGREEAPSQTFAASEGEMGEDGRGAQGESGRKGGRKGRGEVVRERRGGEMKEREGGEQQGMGKKLWKASFHFFFKVRGRSKKKKLEIH